MIDDGSETLCNDTSCLTGSDKESYSKGGRRRHRKRRTRRSRKECVQHASKEDTAIRSVERSVYKQSEDERSEDEVYSEMLADALHWVDILVDH
jgi:hypothetical protein